MEIIKINNLTRDYGYGNGIFNLSLSIKKGEIFGFIGPNGAGKTTTIRHLLGFLRPEIGYCTINGMDCWNKNFTIQKYLGYIPGEMSFPNEMTGLAFLKFYAKYRGLKDEGRMSELLDRFELDVQTKIKKMSKGMKQKLGIVAAFMHNPDVLILDEPTSGLDPLMQNRFIDLILEEKKEGKTILMSSHIFDEVERTCHRVGIIKKGVLAAVDSVDTLKSIQVKSYVVTLESERDAIAFSKENLVINNISQNHVSVTVQNNMKDFIAAMNRHNVTNLSAPNQRLEEIFLQYYGGEIND